MQFSERCRTALGGSVRTLKAPARSDVPAQSNPEVATRVTEILDAIRTGGTEAVHRYARELDGWDGGNFELDAAAVAASGDQLDDDLRRALELGAERTRMFAA